MNNREFGGGLNGKRDINEEKSKTEIIDEQIKKLEHEIIQSHNEYMEWCSKKIEEFKIVLGDIRVAIFANPTDLSNLKKQEEVIELIKQAELNKALAIYNKNNVELKILEQKKDNTSVSSSDFPKPSLN